MFQSRLNIGFQFRIKPCESNLGLNYKYYMRPCKIWAPYSGHWVEKSLGPKSKYVGPPKKGKKKMFLAYVPIGVSHLEWCFSFDIVKKGFMSRTRVEIQFLWGIESAFSKFTH